jgi:hypothetical protein
VSHFLVPDDLRSLMDGVLMEELLQKGLVLCQPITYEEFLPFSAAGIFTSNLGGSGGSSPTHETPEAEEQLEGRRELEGLLRSAILSEVLELPPEPLLQGCDMKFLAGKLSLVDPDMCQSIHSARHIFEPTRSNRRRLAHILLRV